MTLSVLLSVILFVLDQNVKCSVKRPSALNVPFTANNLNAPFVVLKICVKKMIVPSVRQCAPQLSVERHVSLLKQTVLPYVKRPSVTGHVLNQPPVQDPNVNYNVKNLLVIFKMSSLKKLAAHAQERISLLLSLSLNSIHLSLILKNQLSLNYRTH